MTLTAPSPASAPPSEPAGTSASPTGRSLWRQGRVPLALLLVLVVALGLLGALKSTDRGTLDPRSYAPGGGRAIATLLEQRGVPVRVVEDLEQLGAELEPGSVVLVPQTTPLFRGELAELGRRTERAGAALVVGGADDRGTEELGLEVSALYATDAEERDPRCDLPYAASAGRARAGGVAYEGQGIGCYGDGSDPTLLVTAEGRVTLLGSVSPLTNERLGSGGNARLAIGVLSERQDGVRTSELLWLVPRPDRARPADATSSLEDLVPRGLVWGAVQLAVAIGVLMLWRGRRLGRVVQEPLPVVVRGAEAVEGRARLYRAAGARGQAAEALRAGARDRLVRALGLPADAGRAALVETLAARTGTEPRAADLALFGPAPTDDTELVRLADALDSLQP